MSGRRDIGDARRFQVLQRDRFRCRYCGAHGSEVELHIDHVKPLSAGGSNAITNLVTSCRACNLGKGATELPEQSCLVASPGECLRNIDDPWIENLDFEDIAGWWECTMSYHQPNDSHLTPCSTEAAA